MKLTLAVSFIAAASAAGVKGNLRPATRRAKKKFMKADKKGITYEPGNFSHGQLIKDKYGRRILTANGLTGRVLAYTNQPVQFADGSYSSANYHARADGGAVFRREDDMGWIYVSNDETGSASSMEYTGGAYALKMNEDHEVVDYYPILQGTVDNCAGGRTPWGTWQRCANIVLTKHFRSLTALAIQVSCEEETEYGFCWQTDPEGVITAEKTEVVQYGSNWEAFAWDDHGLKGYTTDDAEKSVGREFQGALARFTPDAAALECYHKETKAERWCTLNSGTTDYLYLEPDPTMSGCGTFYWVAKPEDANSDLYRKGEGIDVTDSILTFAAKEDHLFFELDLEEDTYCQYTTLYGFKQQPDNLRVFNNVVYFNTDSGAPNGVFGYDGEGWYGLLMATDFGSESAGVDFTADGMVMYVSFQTEMTMIFWREDGKPFDYETAGIRYIDDSNNIYFKDGGYDLAR
eukprot:scaffold765_cov160-Amphora_coffeaeformis.AAC.17